MNQQPSPEQIAALQEKIKNMSPEELREFQKKQCIFCQIIEGRVQSKKIYEDAECLAILDINPANPGHLLLMPKEHYAIMPQLPDEILEHLFLVSKKLSNVLLRALSAQGSNILVANGVAAGQKAQHFMIHLIPRNEGDGVGFTIPQHEHKEKELSELAEKLRQKLGTTHQETPAHPLHMKQQIKEAEFKDHQQRSQPKEEPPENKPEEKKQEKDELKEQEDHLSKETEKKESDVNLDDIADLFSQK